MRSVGNWLGPSMMSMQSLCGIEPVASCGRRPSCTMNASRISIVSIMAQELKKVDRREMLSRINVDDNNHNPGQTPEANRGNPLIRRIYLHCLHISQSG